jgi:hypothetical protein
MLIQIDLERADLNAIAGGGLFCVRRKMVRTRATTSRGLKGLMT